MTGEYNPFAPTDQMMMGGSPFSAMGSWGQPVGAAPGMEQLSYLDQLQAEAIQKNMALSDKQGLAFDRMGAPPSKWATGAQTFGSIAQGLAGLGNIYLGFQGMKQQKKAFEFNKEVTNTNLNNSIMDYNRRLSDTLTNRSLNNGGGQSWVSDQLAKYSAKRG
jgi:hypothetical protein